LKYEYLLNTYFQIQDRPTGGLNEEKKRYAHEHEPIAKLSDIVQKLKPTYLIGK
jgi:hypothetical protein